jgi:hypothetical protein
MRHIIVVAVLALLAACSSLNLDTANRLRTLDYANDNLADLVLAFDLPRGVEPVKDRSTLIFDVTTPANGERHLRAVLVLADADETVGNLPPPAANRTYFLYGFSDKDKAALREAQAWARTLPAGGGTIKIAMAPRFCSVAPIDPQSTNVSVLIALPGVTGLAPLISNQKLSDAMAGASLPPC